MTFMNVLYELEFLRPVTLRRLAGSRPGARSAMPILRLSRIYSFATGRSFYLVILISTK